MKHDDRIHGREKGTMMAVLLVFMMVISALPVMAGTDSGGPVLTRISPLPVMPASAGAGGNSVNTVTIQPNATVGKDNWIGNQTGFNTTNYGTDTQLVVGNLNAINYRSLVQFDVPSPTAALDSATLSMYCNQVIGAPTNVSVYGLTSAWDEGTGNGAVGASSWEHRIIDTTPLDIIYEDFEGTFPPTGWSVIDNAGTGGVWDRNDAFGVGNRCGGTASGYSAAAEAYTSGIAWDTELWSPALDLTSMLAANLSFESNFQDFASNGDAWVDVSTDGGGTWTNEWYWTSDHGPTFENIDLSGYAGSTVILRWRYACTSATAWYWHIDNVHVQGLQGVPWNSPGGDFNSSVKSNIEVGQANTWYSWDVTGMVQNWMDGTWANNGFILMPDFLPAGLNWVGFHSSDYITDPALAPKLTLTYSAEIDPLVPAQTLNEDDPARTIDLAGRGHGSVVHQSGPQNGTNNFPFGATWGDSCHYQALYTSDMVGAEGVIRSIAFNRTNTPIQSGNFSNFQISMAHTTVDSLTTTFANNYQGYLIEVLNEANVFLNSSDGDSWIIFLLNENFTYDSQYNLLIDIKWSGDGENDVNIRTTSTPLNGKNVRIWNFGDNTAPTGSVGTSSLPVLKFTIDAKNTAIRDVVGGGSFPFTPVGTSSIRYQLLYNHSMLNESGKIGEIAFQSNIAGNEYGVMENFSIRMAHSLNDSLDANFDEHYTGQWVEVLNSASYNMTADGLHGWIKIKLDNAFDYNGNDNLLVDIRWNGGYGSADIWTAGTAATYNARLYAFDYLATTGTSSPTLNNIQLIFLESDNLTWSASSSNTGLFTAATIGNSLRITPMPDANGIGTAYLTLHNSDGQTVTQTIPVMISPVNDAPFFTSVPGPVQCTEDVNFTLNVTANVLDIDNDLANLTFSTDSMYASTSGGPEIVFNYPEGITSDFVNITVRDPSGLTGTAMVQVTITPVNDMPEFTGYVNTLTCDATVPRTYTVHPADEETVTGQLLVYTSSQYAAVSNQTITFLYPKGIGSESVSIYLVDGSIYGTQNNRTYNLAVTVNDHPEIITHSPNGTGVPVTTAVTVTFDMAMNRTTAQSAFTMTLGTEEINGTFSWNAGNTTLTFTPSHVLTNGLYNVSMGTGAESQTGFGMLNGHGWNFTAALGGYDGDGDGMPDQYEIDNGLDPKLDDAQGDLDGDGMPNIYEYRNNLDPGVNDGLADADGDGTTNIDEYNAGTDPNNPDDSPAKPLGIIPILLILAVIIAVMVIVLVIKRRGQNPPPPPNEWQEPGQDTEPPLEQGTQEPYAQEPPPPPPGELSPEYPIDSQ